MRLVFDGLSRGTASGRQCGRKVIHGSTLVRGIRQVASYVSGEGIRSVELSPIGAQPLKEFLTLTRTPSPRSGFALGAARLDADTGREPGAIRSLSA